MKKMKNLIITFALFFVSSAMMGQNLIGKSVDDVKKSMKKLYPALSCDDSNLKSLHSTLKFTDKDDLKTLMFFFDESKKCEMSKFMLDNSLLKNSLDTLNKKYDYKGSLKWIESSKGKQYEIILQKNEWFFTLIIQNKK